MKPLRKRLEEIRNETGLPWEIIERDYILSWILAGIGENKELCDSLIFKGGTALKKCYFGKYRFSEDLDFTAKQDAPKENRLEKEIQQSCRLAIALSQHYSPLELMVERYTEKEPHPNAQEAFIVRGKFPWHRQFLARAIIEITIDEPVMVEPLKRQIIHDYGEIISQKVSVYTLEEIIAEKMRAILQHLQKLEERGWSRSRARDYFDLWNVLNHYAGQLKIEILPNLFLEKCKVREVNFAGPEVFFNSTIVNYVAETWDQWLGPLVFELPAFEKVKEDLKQKFFDLFEY